MPATFQIGKVISIALWGVSVCSWSWGEVCKLSKTPVWGVRVVVTP